MNRQHASWRGPGLGAACAVALLAAAGGAAAKVEGVTGTTFTLVARGGYISTADGGSVYMWGYGLGNNGATCAGQTSVQMQYPGPTLIVQQGATITIRLCNQLPSNVSVILPGQFGVASAGGAVGRITREARPYQPPASAGNPLLAVNTVTYTFAASRPGTYLYQSGTQMNVQNEMGLVGALVVRPSGAPAQAYEHAGTRFDREHLLMLSEVDPAWHESVREQAAATPVPPTGAAGSAQRTAYNAFDFLVNAQGFAARNPLYWFINGRNAPDTMVEAFAPQFPAQPYNALPRMHPGERLLMRMVNAGSDLHPFHHHGNNTWTIAVDGRPLASGAAAGPDLARSDNTLRMIPGQTVDAIYEWTGRGLNWDVYGVKCGGAGEPTCATAYDALDPRMSHQDPAERGRPIPTVIPSALEMTFGDMYSGSPFLGSTGGVPVGAGRLGSGGAFFHMFHSHNEREIINSGVFPGGMMTMVVIEPWNVPID